MIIVLVENLASPLDHTIDKKTTISHKEVVRSYLAQTSTGKFINLEKTSKFGIKMITRRESRWRLKCLSPLRLSRLNQIILAVTSTLYLARSGIMQAESERTRRTSGRIRMSLMLQFN